MDVRTKRICNLKSFGLVQISYISCQPWLPFYYTTIIIDIHNCVPNASRKD